MGADGLNVTYGANLGNNAVSPAPNINAVGIAFPKADDWAGHLYGYNPKRYSGKILRKFYQTCVMAQISNTDYEGDIKDYGDTVIIRTTPDIQVKDYKKGQDLTYDTYDTDIVSLTIDKGKYWAFVTNPVDKKQTDIKSFVENWTSDAAKRVNIAIERELLAYAVTQADSTNSGSSAGAVSGAYNLGTAASPRAVTKDTILSVVTDSGSCLAENDIPTDTEECWMVVPQKIANLMALGDLARADVMGDGKSQLLKGGQNKIPQLDVFNVYRSNLMPPVKNGTTPVASSAYILFGHRDALTFAAQLKENEALPNPRGFGTLHRGLMIYGFKVIQPKCLGVAVVSWANGGGSNP